MTVLINRQARGGWWHKLQIPGLLPGVGSSKAGHRPPVWEKPELSLEINSFLACLRRSSCLWLTEHPGICSQGLLRLPWHAQARPPCSCLPTYAEEGDDLPTCQDCKGNHTLTSGSAGLGGMGAGGVRSAVVLKCPYALPPGVFQACLAEAGPLSCHEHDWGHQLDLQGLLGTQWSKLCQKAPRGQTLEPSPSKHGTQMFFNRNG